MECISAVRDCRSTGNYGPKKFPLGCFTKEFSNHAINTLEAHAEKTFAVGGSFVSAICARADEADTTLVITSPTTLQVFQRTADDQADVIIQGTLSGPADTVEAKAELVEGATRGKQTEWVLIADKDDLSSGTFAGELSLQAGGWYTITVRARKGAQIVAKTTIDKTGLAKFL